MRYFLSICFFLLQTVAVHTATAAPVSGAVTSRDGEAPILSSSSACKNLYAEHVHTLPGLALPFKGRAQRPHAGNGVLTQAYEASLPPVWHETDLKSTVSSGPSIGRLLLYPKHYFW